MWCHSVHSRHKSFAAKDRSFKYAAPLTRGAEKTSMKLSSERGEWHRAVASTVQRLRGAGLIVLAEERDALYSEISLLMDRQVRCVSMPHWLRVRDDGDVAAAA